MHCPFCDIVTNKKDRILRETADTIAVLSNPRLMPGHLLVIPKKHCEKLCELSSDERSKLFDEVVYWEEKILTHIAPGCDISQHYRPFIPEGRVKVNHMHVHLRPRHLEDELFQEVQRHEMKLFLDLKKQECDRITKLLSPGTSHSQ